MCFSPQISFFSAVLLLCIGIATLFKVRSKKQILFASIPFFFSAQQFAEGILWLTLPHRTNYPSVVTGAATLFLSIAFIVWPIMIPASVYLIEKKPSRKLWIALCTFVGALWSGAAFYLLTVSPILVNLECCHISYDISTSAINRLTALLLYCVATILPFWISSNRHFNIFGTLLAASCAVSYFAWYYYFTSIWCFFVAILSAALYHIISLEKLD